ncbi:N-acetylglucosamine kinase [Christiangramia fulva]|nr:N-acetylglucosamine kinase [Christiangramia fulva]
MKEIFQKLMSPAAEIIIKGDMAAAVYSVTLKPAVVCILGTGSNSCFFDGKNIVQRMPSLGYLLDDAGSGNAIGREILQSYYFEKMPRHLRRIFDQSFNMELEFVLTQLYQKSFPNRYLASFTKLAIQNLDKPFFKDLIRRNIQNFLIENLQPYKEELQCYPVHFIGSVAYYCRNIIEEELLQLNYKPGNFVKSPIDALVDNMLESPA